MSLVFGHARARWTPLCLQAAAAATLGIAAACTAGEGNGAAATLDGGNDDGAHTGPGSVADDGGSGGGTNPDGATPDGAGSVTVDWPSAACQSQTAALLARMTRAQKAAQMVSGVNPADSDVMAHQYGSVLAGGSNTPASGNTPALWAAMTDSYLQDTVSSPLGIPEIYAIDAVHGNSHPSGTVIFPHAIGLGSTRDPALVTQVGQMTALESIATGVTMTYAPQASVAWDARWGRFYETFSEDPDWAAEMVVAEVLGLQGPGGLGTGTPGIISCAKHWAGDGQGTAGKSRLPGWTGVVDRSDIEINMAQMQRYGMDVYAPAMKAGLGCIMVSDTTWNGSWITSSSEMITTLLKGTYAFKGFVISDWNANVNAGGIEPTINAGVDMLMEPNGPPSGDSWVNAVTTIANSTAIPDSRIDDAVTRILNVKCQAGLFGFKRDTTLLADVGSASHRALARRAVAESLVVLQNNNHVLPLSKTAKVWVGGSGANSLSNQCGGWTINWQGNGNATTGTTISQAIGKVTTLAQTMNTADIEVVVLSETPYAETPGDSPTLNTLPAGDLTLLSQARATGKPVVAIVMSGRTPLITNALGNADAWIAAWLPGTEGEGVADILFGDVKPTGKLSHSWRRDDTQANFMTCCNSGTAYNPLFPLGFGLTY
jgi:beta-glucosidase